MVETTTATRAVRCVVVTPEKAVLDQEADFVALPMFDGELGVLPGRAPLVGRLGYGELRITHLGKTKRFFVDGGFVQVRDNVVTVLTSRALREEALTVAKANEALQESLKPGETPEEQEAKLKAQQRARAQLRMAQRKQERGSGLTASH